MHANERSRSKQAALPSSLSNESDATPDLSAAPALRSPGYGAVRSASQALPAPADVGRGIAACMLFGAALMLGVWVLLAGEAAADSHLTGEIIDFDIIVSDTPLTVGDTIVFTNSGAQPHTVTDRAGTFDTNGIAPGDSAEVTFDVPGTYEIFCRINPGSMNATVVVEAGDDPPSEIRIQTFDTNREGETLRFDPPEAEIPTGSWVTVANVGGAPHTLTADDGSFDTGEIAPGAEQGRFAGEHARFRVDEPGVYDFRCLIHPEAMQGTLTVVGDAVDDSDEPDPDPPPDEPSDPGAGATDSAAVTIANFTFDPFEVAVLPAAEVTWTNEDGAPHTATFDEVEGRVEGLDTGSLSTGESGTLTAPDAPGSYSYFCAIHPSMRGVLVVAAGAAGADDGDDGGGDGNGSDEPAGDDLDGADPVAAPPPVEEDSNTAALVGAIAIVVAGLGAIVIALRGGRRREEAAE